MSSFKGLRDYINDRLIAVAVEIFTVVEQTIVQHQEEVDAQKLDFKWREETKIHTTELRRRSVCKEEQINLINSSFDHGNPDPSQIKENQEQLEVKEEAEAVMVTFTGDECEHRENRSSLDSVKVFINGQLTAAAVEIFTVVEQTIVQYQEEGDAQSRLQDISWKEKIKYHTTELSQPQHFQGEQLINQEKNSRLDQDDPEHPQIKEEQTHLEVKEEADTIMVTIIDDGSEHRLISHCSAEDVINVQLCKEKQLFNKAVNLSLEREEPEFSRIKDNLQVHCTGQMGEQLVLKQEADADMVTPSGYQRDNSLPKPDMEQVPQDSNVTKKQNEKNAFSENSESISSEEFLLNGRYHIPNLDNYPIPENQCETESSNKGLTCDICGKAFKSKSQARQHYRIHTGEKPFQCNTCSKTFTDSSSLRKHIMIHTGEKPHSCEICGKSFNRQDILFFHKRIHTGEKPHSCEICGKNFNHQSPLIRHKRIHTGERPYCCETCGKSFTRLIYLSSHIKSHTGEKPHSCETCGKNFSHQSHLIRHKINHTGERPYSCETCGKSFTQQIYLSSHIKTHTGEKPHSCETCGKSFNTQSNLLGHMKIHTDEKPHSCETCGKKFHRHSNMLRHKMTHSDKKPHSCKICGKSFIRQNSLLEHMITHTF